MITWFRTRIEGDEEGFTLIELLVVVIIIGILAAIAIPTFLRQREKGWDAASESELRNAAIAAESYATSNNGTYSGLTVALLQGEGYNQSQAFSTAPGTFAVNVAANAWCMQASHSSQATRTFAMSNTTGAPAPGTCTGTPAVTFAAAAAATP